MNRKTSAFFDLLPNGIILFHLDGTVALINTSAKRHLGISRSKNLQLAVEKVVFRGSAETIRRIIKACNTAGKSGVARTFVVRRSGGLEDSLKIGFARVRNELFSGVMGTFNIPERKKLKCIPEEPIGDRIFLENVINTVATPIFVKNERFEWVLFNQSFLDGRKPSDLLGKTDFDFLHRNLADQIREREKQVFRTGETLTVEEPIPGKDGNIRTVITTTSRFIDETGRKFLIGVMMDISERKRFENIVTHNNAIFRAVMESTSSQFLAIDINRRYIWFNNAHAEFVSLFSRKEIRRGDYIMDLVSKEIVDRVDVNLKQTLKGERFTDEVTLPNKTVLKVSHNPIVGENDEIVGAAIFVDDITDRKKTEMTLKALNDELTEQNWQLAAREDELKVALDQLSERNFEMDQLMYKTSHDLRSPLSSILGLVNLAHLDKNPENLGHYLVKIEGRIKKLDEFINSMVTYARVNRGEMTTADVDLYEVVKSTVRELEYLENFNAIRVEIDVVNDGKKLIRNDPFLVNIIIGNIISNAYKYYNPEVSSFLRITIDVSPSHAVMEFSDNGIGIRKEHHDKVFDMFYRATDRSKGSGLGMYIVKQAIEKVNGSITMRSTYGEGTMMRIVLPDL